MQEYIVKAKRYDGDSHSYYDVELIVHVDSEGKIVEIFEEDK